jgi:precorrin-6Y C5,15-methyltransferase (decarboxylating)
VPHCASGQPDSLFDHDGQITKRPLRALTLSALAPRPRERLWDIGAGSGSIAIEWLLAHPACQAVAIEADAGRAGRLRANADRLGMDRLVLVHGRAPEALAGLSAPDAVFVGGGLSAALLATLWQVLPPGCRLVANAVTLESEALLGQAQAIHGGSLLRIELAEAAPLGARRGWKASYPVVQWSVLR